MSTLALNTICSRCGRVESVEIVAEDVAKLTKVKKPKALVVSFDEKVVIDLDALCTACRAAVEKTIKTLGKTKHKSRAKE